MKFIHPGIGCTEETLEILRQMVREGREPWASYYEGLLKTGYASVQKEIRGVSQINNDDDIARFREDCETAWTQAVIYSVTGDKAYLALPLKIFTHYSKTENFFPKCFPDSHIKLGKYVYTMCAAADILCGDIPKEITLAMAENSLKPIVERALHNNGYFMNQHTYSIIGVLAYSILSENEKLYRETVEWALVNKHAAYQSRNGAMTSVIRKVTYDALSGLETESGIELVEMGRDQAHAEGNINNLLMMTKTMHFQRTRVNSSGEEDEHGEDPIFFADNRLMEGFELYARHNIGGEIKWIPTAAEDVPDRVIYDSIAPEGFGSFSVNGMAAAYYTYRMLGKEPTYVKLAYEAMYPRFSRAARGGRFIETLHNYAFDFWIGLTREAQLDKALEADDKNFKNVSVGGVSLLKAGETAVVFRELQSGAFFGFRTSASASLEILPDGGKKIVEYLPNTKGNFKKVFLDFKSRSFFKTKVCEGVVEFGTIEEKGEKITWCDDTEIYDVCLGKEIGIDTGFDSAHKIKKITPKAVGKYEFYVTAEKGEYVRAKKITLNVEATLEDAVKRAAEHYDFDLEYESESRKSVLEALKDGDLRRIRRAADKARKLNPLLEDGSLDYRYICKTNYDCFLENFADGDPKKFGSIWDREKEFVMDFGERYKIEPRLFGIRARGGFPRRVRKSAFYGSNDASSWTPLTDFAAVSPYMQYLLPKCSGTWRYIKIKREDDPTDVGILDIGTLRIFARRHEKV